MKDNNRRDFLRVSSISLTSLPLLLNTLSYSGFNSKKPNIVFFLVDDLGWRNVGYMG